MLIGNGGNGGSGGTGATLGKAGIGGTGVLLGLDGFGPASTSPLHTLQQDVINMVNDPSRRSPGVR